ncbi:MAG: hypothetical protein EA382_01405 [Spirochaetaceae bacterium]|nr:MAG: hypothetical protein EA382_01405 [Spirochaetaceae bacterium]
MKRVLVALLLVIVLGTGAVAQDLQLLGQDVRTFVNGLGAELLPGLGQSAMWGRFPGSAVYPQNSNFFVTLSVGTILTSGILDYPDPDSPENPFEVLNLPRILSGELGAAGDLLSTAQSLFPLPIARISGGVRLPADVELMVDLAGFPQLITGFAADLAGMPGVEFSALHVGTRVRKGILKDVGAFPAVSIGGGYSYSGFRIGYDLSTIGNTDAFDGYGSTPVGPWELFLTGDFNMGSRIHSFGVDLQASKAFGFFVPFIGLSPYYQIASFYGNIGGPDAATNTFDAFIAYDSENPAKDVQYTAAAPIASWVDNDLTLLLHGGFDLVFGGFVIEVHGSWAVAKGHPGLALGMRFQ